MKIVIKFKWPALFLELAINGLLKRKLFAATGRHHATHSAG